MLWAVVIPNAFRSPSPVSVCLVAHDKYDFQLTPQIEIIVDGQPKLLPDNIGMDEECIKPIHTDEIGSQIHVQYTRPIRFTMEDFMTGYLSSTGNGDRTIIVIDNSTGVPQEEAIQLDRYDAEYSYYDNASDFAYPERSIVKVDRLDEFPPFTNDFVGRIELNSK